MRPTGDVAVQLEAVHDRLRELEHQAELLKTVLIVREPDTVHSSVAFDGLRKQVIASSGERRAHLVQLSTMAVALGRAQSLDDLRPQVKEWLDQAGIVEIRDAPPGIPLRDFFEFVGPEPKDSSELEVVEPAYLDSQTTMVLRQGRARRREPSPASDAKAETTAGGAA